MGLKDIEKAEYPIGEVETINRNHLMGFIREIQMFWWDYARNVFPKTAMTCATLAGMQTLQIMP